MMLQQDLFPDIIIRAQQDLASTDIPCHKMVLSIGSGYFRAMFASSFKESAQRVIEVHEDRPTALQNVIGALYTNQLRIDDDPMAQDILIVASKYQFTRIQEEIEEVMAKNLQASNITPFYHLSSTFNCSKLAASCSAAAMELFLSASGENTNHIPKELLVQVLQSHTVRAHRAKEVCIRVLTWLHANSTLRDPEACLEMLIHVQFGLMTAEDQGTILQLLAADPRFKENHFLVRAVEKLVSKAYLQAVRHMARTMATSAELELTCVAPHTFWIKVPVRALQGSLARMTTRSFSVCGLGWSFEVVYVPKNMAPHSVLRFSVGLSPRCLYGHQPQVCLRVTYGVQRVVVDNCSICHPTNIWYFFNCGQELTHFVDPEGCLDVFVQFCSMLF